MDKQREKLIEIVNSTKIPVGKQFATTEDVVDNLLANNVFVPPCKVGTPVYFIEADIGCVWKGEIRSWSPQKDGLWFYAKYDCGLTYWHKEGDIGKTVFFTEQGAIKILKAERGQYDND